MPELHLQRADNTLTISLGDHTDIILFTDIALSEEKIEHLYRDAASYGRALFDQIFRDEAIRNRLASLRANERLVLVAEDPLVASIPWEYLRDQNDKLLASRLTFVRGLPQTRRREDFTFSGALEIVALPVSAVDVQPVLNVEGEWKNLVEAVSTTMPLKALTVRRVRPPTRSQLERSLNRRSTSIVHFMGHSTSSGDKAFLTFEDARARKHLIDSADFIDSLNERVFLVVLNSCLSAVAARTELGNIAQALVQGGIPYALGMQFTIPDNAALVLSEALYDFLLQGHTVEEAVTHMRRALQEPGKLPNAPWLAGVPVLYTSLRTPALPLELAEGRPTIQPDPERLQKTCDLTALPRAEHFVGRSDEISEVLSVLLAPGAHGFVLLHGLGGIGKTSLAQEVARRIGYAYADRVLAVSFETFSTFDAQNQVVINEQFADNFYNRLARFYGLDPADTKRYPTPAALQQAILQQWTHLRTLLVLDNIETLIDAQRRNVPAATSLASFISRLKEGDGAVLLTSRMVPPSDWGDCPTISIGGLGEEAGADLFLALLPANRAHKAPQAARLALSQRVDGHPLSIRLLAGRFADESATDLATFLEHIEAELEHAEQATPASLEDPARQKTLYACMDYSVRRLAPEQRNVLDAVSLFQAPFLSEFATHLLNDEEQTPLHLQHLLRLGLLTATVKTLQDGELILLELHPMLRWYIQQHLPQRDAALLERYGEVYKNLARQAYEEYDRSALVRYLLRQGLADCEAALQYLPPASRSSLAYLLAKPYQRLGQNRRAVALYEQALELAQELGDVRGVAVTQNAMAKVLSQLGKPQEALALYEQSLRTKQELGDVHGVAVTQGAIADVLSQQGKPGEALALYEQALRTYQELGDVRGVAVTQYAMAKVLSQLGKPQEALALYEQALRTYQELGDVRSIAVTQHAMVDVLVDLGKPGEALALYEQSLRTKQELGDVREVAVTQHAMAKVLVQQGQPQEAMALYEQSLRTKEELGDVREVAVTQHAMAKVLRQIGRPQEAMALYEQVLRTVQTLGDVQAVATTQANLSQLLLQQGEPRRALVMAWEAYTSLQRSGFSRDAQIIQELLISLKGRNLGPEQFDTLWSEVISRPQPEWLGHVQVGSSSRQVGVSNEVMQAVRDFVNADDWDASREVVETRHELLFRAEVERIFEQNIEQGRSAGEERTVRLLEMHLALLRACKSVGIAEAFRQLVDEQEEDALPFDAELVPRSIAALLGGPQQKMEYMGYLNAQFAQASEEGLKALLQMIQLALFSNDLSQLGRELQGVYRQAWEAIVVGVEADGVDPQIFDQIANNTLAVLGPAASRRSEWRNNLVEVRNGMTARGNRNMTALLDALIGLLDAGGNPAGLGQGLKGVYARTWQAVVEHLPR